MNHTKMSDIEYIKNVLVAKHFNYNPAEMSTQLTGMPDSNPDECVIRSIVLSTAIDGSVYLLWCNLKNDFIGSICGGTNISISPQIRIWLTGPVPNTLEFRLYSVMPAGPLFIPSFQGDISIHIDFIKYKRTAVHA
jgi:hypothetical protein